MGPRVRANLAVVDRVLAVIGAATYGITAAVGLGGPASRAPQLSRDLSRFAIGGLLLRAVGYVDAFGVCFAVGHSELPRQGPPGVRPAIRALDDHAHLTSPLAALRCAD